MSRVLSGHHLGQAERWLPSPPPEPEPPPPDPQVLVEEIVAKAAADAAGEAQRLVEGARAEADRIRQEAYDAGYAAGHAQGCAASQHACDEKIAEYTALMNDLRAERELFFDSIEPDMVRLARAIAEKILTQQLSMKPEMVVEIARAHIRRIREREVLRLRVNPDDLPILADERQTLIDEIDGVRELQLNDDRRVGRGGMIIETESGALDARISTQFEVIDQALGDAMEASDESEDG